MYNNLRISGSAKHYGNASMSDGRGGSEFGICFELGRALRRGDVEAFFTVYDKLIPRNAQVSFLLTKGQFECHRLTLD